MEIYPEYQWEPAFQSYRQIVRWMGAFQGIVGWIVRQAFLTSSLATRESRRACLCINMKQVLSWCDHGEARSSFYPESFEFRSLQDDELHIADHAPAGSILGFYEINMRENVRQYMGWVLLNQQGEPLLRFRGKPLWPWVTAQCTLYGDIHPRIARLRLGALIHSFKQWYVPDGLLDQFATPSMSMGIGDKFLVEEESLKKWMNIFYPIVAHIRSRFHLPYPLLEETYGHLLLQCPRRDPTPAPSMWG